MKEREKGSLLCVGELRRKDSSLDLYHRNLMHGSRKKREDLFILHLLHVLLRSVNSMVSSRASTPREIDQYKDFVWIPVEVGCVCDC